MNRSGNGYFRTPEGYFGDQAEQIEELQRRLALGPAVPPFPAQGTIRSAFLPVTYRGWGPTAVVIDGVLSTDVYNWATPYIPNAARMVRLVSDGTTWIIMGQVSDETVYLPFDETKFDIYGERSVDVVWNLRPRATKLALSGLVVLSGMMLEVGTQPNGVVLGTLPVGMRPSHILVFPIEYGDSARALYISPNGNISVSSPPSANAYLSLDGIAFHPAGVGTWTAVGSSGSAFATGFSAWSADYPCEFYKDPWGIVWYRGLVRVTAAQSVNGNPMINVPAPYRAHATQHFRTTANDVHGAIYVNDTSGVTWMVGSPATVGAWISLTGAVAVSTDALTLNPWKNIKGWANGWAAYGGVFPTPAYCRRADGLVMMKGLTNSGTVNTKQTSLTQEETWPSGGRIILAAISNQQRARMDVFSARDNEASTGGTMGSVFARGTAASWFSWDGLKWLP